MKLYRPVTVVVGVLFVVAGGLLRLIDPVGLYDEPTRETERAVIGQRIAVGESAVEVERIRFARTVLASEEAGEEPRPTDGVFLAVELDAIRGAGARPSLEATLRSAEGTVYRPLEQLITTAVDFPDPGFVRSSAFVFEVNPTDLAGLSLMLRPSSLYTVLVTDYAVDLGLPDDKTAAEQVSRSAQTYLLTKPVTRVAS
jgi:hypothetical protein